MQNEMRSSKDIVFEQLIKRIEDRNQDFTSSDEYFFRRKVMTFIKSVLHENRKLSLTPAEQEEIVNESIPYFLGFGPLVRFLHDPEVSEVMINGCQQVYVEKNGKIQLTDFTFKDESQLNYFVEKVVLRRGKNVTELEPYGDSQLKDGSRANIVISPVSLKGTLVTIRRFGHRAISVEEILKSNALSKEALDFLKACVVARLNILVAGGASSGKTTLLNILSGFAQNNERIITIEDTPELKLTGEHVLPLVTRASNITGEGEISIRDLVRNSLHMRPDRIIVGEVRSDEALDMLQAMNTGHDGSMTTLHANSPLDALDRLEVLALMGKANLSSEVVKRQIISTINLIIYMRKFPDGSRRAVHIAEVVKEKNYTLEDIFIYDEQAGKLRLTGKVPSFYHKLKKNGGYTLGAFETEA